MIDGLLADEQITVELAFVEHRGKKVLLPDETDIARFKHDVQEQRDGLNELLKKAQAETEDRRNVEQEKAITHQLEELNTRSERYLVDREARRREATVVEALLTTYSYLERITIRDKMTVRDPETQDRYVNEDLVVAELLKRHLVSLDGKTLTEEQKKKLVGPVAMRLWRELRERSEPSEADLF